MENLMISLEIGRFFSNRTARYLFPILNTYSQEFLHQFNKVSESLMCVAVGDMKYEYAKNQEVRHCLFFVFDINGKYDLGLNRYMSELGGRKIFNDFLSFVRKYKYYENDYRFDSIKGHKHCIVLKLPDEFRHSYNFFLKSTYSRMYTEKQLEKLKIKKMIGTVPNSIWSILMHDKGYKETFQSKLNNFFGTTVTIQDDREFDLPIRLDEEKLNHN